MKIILNVCGTANIGKTTSVRYAYQKLSGEPIDAIPNEIVGDKTVTIQGKKIGFVSYGDTGENLAMLKVLVEIECDIIVCASRSKGAPIDSVWKIAENYDYQIIQMRPFTVFRWNKTKEEREKCVSSLIEINANAIVEFIHEAIKL